MSEQIDPENLAKIYEMFQSLKKEIEGLKQEIAENHKNELERIERNHREEMEKIYKRREEFEEKRRREMGLYYFDEEVIQERLKEDAILDEMDPWFLPHQDDNIEEIIQERLKEDAILDGIDPWF